jgi:hypothetical protein
MQSMETIDKAKEQLAAQVKVLKLEPGDILVAKLGIANMGEGLPPWIPMLAELESVRDDLLLVVPKDVRVLIHHMGLEFETIRNLSEADRVLVES